MSSPARSAKFNKRFSSITRRRASERIGDGITTRMSWKKDFGREKADKALKLIEQGIPQNIIAERLGTSSGHIAGMIQRAKRRREKEAAK